jgi:hypothetical protein
MKVPWRRVKLLLMAHAYLQNRNNTPFVTLPRKDTNHLSCSVLCFIKCLQTREKLLFLFDFPHCQRGLVKPKLTKTKWVLMRLDATTLTDKKTNLQF